MVGYYYTGAGTGKEERLVLHGKWERRVIIHSHGSAHITRPGTAHGSIDMDRPGRMRGWAALGPKRVEALVKQLVTDGAGTCINTIEQKWKHNVSLTFGQLHETFKKPPLAGAYARQIRRSESELGELEKQLIVLAKEYETNARPREGVRPARNITTRFKDSRMQGALGKIER